MKRRRNQFLIVLIVSVSLALFYFAFGPLFPNEVIKFSPVSCSDSDAGQSEYLVMGTTTEYTEGSNRIGADSCSSNQNTLIEFYCYTDASKPKSESNSVIKSKEFDCSSLGDYKCSEGRCVMQKHSICSARKTCVIAVGSGTDECLSDVDC